MNTISLPGKAHWGTIMLACFGACAAALPAASARSFHTAYGFPASFNGPLPANPHGSLVADSQGRLHGVTIAGGTLQAGTVYRLTPGALKSAPWDCTTA